MSLFGQRVFADIVKLRVLRSSRIRVGPKSNAECLCKRQKRTRAQRYRRESHTWSGTDPGVTHLKPKNTKGCWKPPEARGEVRMNSPSETPEEANSGDILISDFRSPKL